MSEEQEEVYIPLREYLPPEVWPADIFAPEDGESFLDMIAYEGGTITRTEEGVSAQVELRVVKEVSFQLPFGFSILLGKGPISASLNTMEEGFVVNILTEALKLRLPRLLFVPVLDKDGKLEPDPDPSHFVDITLPFGIHIDQDFNIDPDWPGETSTPIILPQCMLGQTGIIISANDIILRLSVNQPLPDGTETIGLDHDWRGLFIREATVKLPPGLGLAVPSDLKFIDCFIGNGGFSGKIVAEWNPAFSGKFFDIAFELQRFQLELVQSTITACDIVGKLDLPFFNEPVDIEVGIDNDGKFGVKLSSASGLYTLTKPGILELELESLGFEIDNGIFVIKLSGLVKPLFAGLSWPKFYVKELTIDSQGHVHVDGGWLDLPEQYSLDFYGFQMEITKLGLGKSDDDGKWVGFSGALKLVDGLTAGGSVEGLRVIWYDDGRSPNLSLNGVGVEFEVPGVLRFKGEVSYRKLPAGNVHRFDGDIKLELTTLDMEVDGQLVIGYDEDSGYPFFAIYLATELPAGIPLWTTGLGLYGMAGLFALQMEPGKRSDEPWYGIGPSEGWYKRSPIGVAELEKWENRQDSLGLGAGVTIGTVSDNGFTFSGRMLFVIVFPGPVLIIEGKANFLEERSSLSKEPIFRALAVLDGRAGTFLIGLDARYKYGQGGELIDIGAGAEAFFSLSDPTAWHLYLGMKDPRPNRIRAQILSLFEANAYFMLDARQLAMGAWIGYDKKWRFGPLRVTLEAWVEGNAILSWKPPHFYGDLWVHGKVELSIFGFGLGLSVDARLAVDVFDPFHVVGEFRVGINLPWPLPDFRVDVRLEWGPQLLNPPIPVPLKEIAIEHFKVTTSWPLPRANLLLLPNYDSNGDGFLDRPAPTPDESAAPPSSGIPVVPMDCRPHITFGRAVNDDGLVGVNPQMPNPEWERIGDPQKNQGPIKVRYSLQEIVLSKWNSISSAWIMVARKGAGGNPSGVKILYGSWAPIPQLPSGEVKPDSDPPVGNVKLWLWSKTAFDYTRHSGGAWNEWFTDRFRLYPCPPPRPDRILCCSFGHLSPRDPLTFPIDCNGKQKILLKPGDTQSASIEALDPPFEGKHHALCFDGKGGLFIYISEPAKSVSITIAPGRIRRERECINFRASRPQNPNNPLNEKDVIFEVNNFDGSLLDPSLLFPSWGAMPGLNCGYRTMITLPNASSSVQLILSSTAGQGVRLIALNADGTTVVDIKEMEDNNMPQTISLSGEGILYVIVEAPNNETLLHEICYESITVEPSAVMAVGVSAEGISYGPFFLTDSIIEVEGKDIREVRIEGKGEVCVVRVCANLGPDPAEVILTEKMTRHLIDSIALWSQTNEVLEPHMVYRLRVVTKVQAQGEGALSSYREELVQTEYAYFQTRGPPGLTDLSMPINYPKSDVFDSGLSDIVRYVRQTVPTTVPAAGEKPSLPRPVYRAYDVGVEFNENYVDLMYRLERRDLGLYLYDNNNRPVRDAQGRLIVLSNRWGATEELKLKKSEETWITIVNRSRCARLDPTVIPNDKTLASSAKGQVLDADTVYEARLVPLLLHEFFSDFSVGDSATGPSGTLKRWIIQDEGANEGPSRWQINEVRVEPGREPARYIEQLSNIWGGTLDGTDPIKPGTMLLYGDNSNLSNDHPDPPGNWTDYRFSVYLRLTYEDDDAIGIVFRYQDAHNYYRFSMDRERKYRRLTKIINSTHIILAEDDFVYQQNRDYLVTIEAIGKSLKLYLDGEIIFDVTDDSFDHGRIGLYCWSAITARFSDIRVDDFRDLAPVVYRFKFTTSKFTDFFHQMHSFQDETWRTNLQPGNPSDADFASLAVSHAVAPSEAQTDSESKAYEYLAEKVFGQDAYKNPEQVQAVRIERDDKILGLFIRSPEPIDWKRIAGADLEFGVATSGNDVGNYSELAKIPGDVKLTGVTFGTAKPNEESVSLLLRQPVDLTGYRIEYRTLPEVFKESTGDSSLFLDKFEDSNNRGLVFKEMFGPNALNHYTIVDEGTEGGPSDWKVSAGHIVQTSNIHGGSVSGEIPDKPGTMAIVRSVPWDNIRLTAILRSSDDDDAIGIVFRYQDAHNYYRFSMDRERKYRRLIKKLNGNISILWEDDVAYNQNQPYTVTIEAYGPRMLGYLDNTFLFSVEEDDATIPSGHVGFYCWNNVGSRFEGLTVETLERDPLVWQPAFDTLDEVQVVDSPGAVSGPSEWGIAEPEVLVQLSNIHVVDSSPHMPGTYALAGNTSWQDMQISLRLRSDTDGAIGVMFRYQDADNYYRFSMERQNSYRRLIKKVGGTVTVLWQDTVQYNRGEDYDLTLHATGSELTGYINGSNIFTVHDNSSSTTTAIGRGRIAFYCWSNSAARFERVVVTDRTRYIGNWIINDEGTIDTPSSWRLGNGIFLQNSNIHGSTDLGSDPSKPGTYAVAGDPTWTDYRLIVKMRSDDNDGAIGVMFRYQDADNYYLFSLDSQRSYRRLVKKENGTIIPLWEDSVLYTVGERFTLTVECISSQLIGYYGDIRLFNVVDSTHSKGRVGLYGWSNTGMQFDQVEVRELPLEAYALFRDRFSYDDRTGWSFLDEGTESRPSNWTTFEGALRQTSDIYSPPDDRDTLDKRGTQALAGDSSWTDVAVKVKLESFDEDAIGLLFRYGDENNYYRFSMDRRRRYRRLVKNVGGTFTLLWEDDFVYDIGRKYELIVVTKGDTLHGYIDGIQIFSISDDGLASGKIGLYCWANSDARFYDVFAYPIDQIFDDWLLDEPFDFLPTDQWAFIDEGDQQGPSNWQVEEGDLKQTSNIFGDNGSPEDKPGTYALSKNVLLSPSGDYRVITHLRSDTDGAIGVMFRYQDADNYYRFSMERQNSYRRLIKKVGGTVTVLWDDDTTSYTDGRDYVLTIDCIGTHLSGYLDGIQIFSISDDGLASGKIGLYCWANPGTIFHEVRVASARWINYYGFGQEARFDAGTQIQIYAGNKIDAPPEKPNIHRRFIASLDDKGQLSLSRKGSDLRIISRSKFAEHTRHFLPDDAYSPLSVKLLRKADDTGFCIFLPSTSSSAGSLLPAGRYRLKMTYHLDNRTRDKGSQILRKAGNSDPEHVIIDIPHMVL